MKKLSNKEYVVIGLGIFGRSVAMQLEANGCRVLALDSDEKRVRMVADYVTLAMCVDVTNDEALEELGGRNFDGAVIAIGHDLEAMVLATIWAKEQGIKNVVVKAYDETSGKVLGRIGADQVIYPERESGEHLANNLVMSNIADAIELTADYSIADIDIPDEWKGQSLKELRLRDRYKANVIAVKRNGSLHINPSADDKLVDDDVLVILAENDVLEKLASLK
jgi:trk system potassium uptake protein TrkA